MAFLKRAIPEAGPHQSPWLQAARPRTLPAAVVPVIVGSAAAYFDGVFDWRAFSLALIGALAIQVAANFANDASDALRGADAGDRIGPVRMVAAGVISARQMWVATWAAIGVAGLCGIGLSLLAGPIVFAIGAASILAMLGYVGGPIPYGYRGLGEVFVFLFFGLVATAGSRLVHDGSAPMWVWLLGIPVGFLATAILVANNLRDIDSDARVGKRTLAVILGLRHTRKLYAVLTWGAIVMTIVLASTRLTPPETVVTVAAAPTIAGLNRMARREEGAGLLPLLAGSARLHLIFGVLLAGGILSGRLIP